MIETDADLTDRIADVLQQETPSPGDVDIVIAAAGDELKRLGRDHERAREVFLDPCASSKTAQAARDNSTALAFGIERLTIAVTHLKAKHKDAVDRVQAEREAARRAEVTAERDKLANELRNDYPHHAMAIANLLARIKANNQRAKAVGIEPVENVVRGIPAHGYINSSPCAYLVDAVRLPDLRPLEAAYGRAIWPSAMVEHKVILPPSVVEAAAREGDKARKIGKQAAAKRKAEAKGSIRRIG